MSEHFGDLFGPLSLDLFYFKGGFFSFLVPQKRVLKSAYGSEKLFGRECSSINSMGGVGNTSQLYCYFLITYPIFVSCFINWDFPRNFYWTSK